MLGSLRQRCPARATATRRQVVPRAAASHAYPPAEDISRLPTQAPTDILYDAVIIGSGMGGLATAGQLIAKGAKVVVLEKYVIPGGSSGHYKRAGYTFDVGSSMMFGLGDKGTTNLTTQCLASVGKKLETVLDPTQVHYHLPKSADHPGGLTLQVWQDYNKFIAELISRFPHEAEGIRGFYGECWQVFNALNVLDLKSLEEPRYLLAEFSRHPLECLTLARYAARNAGDIARKHVKDPVVLKFIDLECFLWSTVDADHSPMISAGMVFCDRHFGGINYPVGGVGKIAEALAEGIEERGGHIVYKANVKEIVTEGDDSNRKAVGVRLSDGRVFRGRTVISNATRWDTFESMLRDSQMPEDERLFRQRYKKAPSFFSLHLGIKAEVFEAKPGREAEKDCHHIILEDWNKMEADHGTLFVSLPSLLDPSLAPPGRHIVRIFTPDWIDNWKGLDNATYEARKEKAADALIKRAEAIWPGLADAIEFKEVGTPRTHRRFLNREDGTYGPIPARKPLGVLSMPLSRTSIPGLYCVGDSTFPGQGVNAVVFSGFGAAHRVAVDVGLEPGWPVLDVPFNNFLTYVRNNS